MRGKSFRFSISAAKAQTQYIDFSQNFKYKRYIFVKFSGLLAVSRIQGGVPRGTLKEHCKVVSF